MADGGLTRAAFQSSPDRGVVELGRGSLSDPMVELKGSGQPEKGEKNGVGGRRLSFPLSSIHLLSIPAYL
ncbi:hypothetical protein CHARACLAT_006108 [Characodon lateralis]|uniref:Uncharacterized protein n=1 Tax=Characodon lateralis TaxID=208331 RepID=A0ABU7DZS5_9TELE|nr:hypothetical protein [Characodon lateralis]